MCRFERGRGNTIFNYIEPHISKMIYHYPNQVSADRALGQVLVLFGLMGHKIWGGESFGKIEIINLHVQKTNHVEN